MNKDDNMVELHYKNLSLDDIVYLDDNGVQKTEVWGDVPEIKGFYQISDLGRVKSFRKKAPYIMSVSIERYCQVRFKITPKNYYFRVHKLVAMVFLNHKPDGTQTIVVDHINNEKLDNRLSNLQLITQRENVAKIILTNKTSKYKGVSYRKKEKVYSSCVIYNGKNINLGCFKTEDEASEYYQNALKAIKNGDEIIRKVRLKIKTSKYIGVHFSNTRNRWMSNFTLNKKHKHIGVFKTEIEAYEAREKYIKNLNLQE